MLNEDFSEYFIILKSNNGILQELVASVFKANDKYAMSEGLHINLIACHES
jgi:hypothetical protein